MAFQENSRRLQFLLPICAIAAIGGFLFGFDTAVISGVIGFVKDEYGMSAAREGWFVSSALLGCIIGVGFAGKLSDRFGRKKIMLLSAFLFTISALGCMLTEPEGALISFRLIGGLGIGVASMVSPLYITEFAPAILRGRMVALYQLAITIGILCAYFSNAWLLDYAQLSAARLPKDGFWVWVLSEHVWRSMLGVCVIPAVVFIICLLLIPESPRWLYMQGQADRARQLLYKVNDIPTADQELTAIEKSLEARQAGIQELLRPVYKRALFIGLLLPFLSQLSGINAVIYYGPRILDEAGFTLGGAFGGQVTIGVINVLFTFVAIFTVDKWGRRPLLYVGAGSACLALIIIGVLFAFHLNTGTWILVMILIYIASFAISFGPVCWIIIGEIFPNFIRGRAMGLATLSLWVANFFVGWLTPVLLDNVGAAGTFWLFALLCAPTLWLTWRFIPETKGKSLESIEQYWHERIKA